MRQVLFYLLVAAAGAAVTGGIVFGGEFVAAVIPHGGLF
jgi:hypothetical protein